MSVESQSDRSDILLSAAAMLVAGLAATAFWSGHWGVAGFPLPTYISEDLKHGIALIGSGLLLMAWLLRALRSAQLRLPDWQVLLIAAAFILSLVISSLNAVNTQRAIFVGLQTYLMPLLVFMALAAIKPDKVKTAITVGAWVVVATASVVIVVSWLQITNVDKYLPTIRVGAFFYLHNLLGEYLIVALPCVFLLLLQCGNWLLRLLLAIVLLAGLWALMATGARGAWVGLLFASCLGLLLYGAALAWRNQYLKAGAHCLLTILLICSALFAGKLLLDNIKSLPSWLAQLESSFEAATSGSHHSGASETSLAVEGKTPTAKAPEQPPDLKVRMAADPVKEFKRIKPSQSSWRLETWQDNWQLIRDSYITGLGPGHYKIHNPAYIDKAKGLAWWTLRSSGYFRYSFHPHNDYLETLNELGALGLLALLVLFALITIRSAIYIFTVADNSSRLLAVGLFVSFCAWAASAFFEFPMRMSGTAYLGWAVTGLLSALIVPARSKVSLKPIFNCALTFAFITVIATSAITYGYKAIQGDRYRIAANVAYAAKRPHIAERLRLTSMHYAPWEQAPAELLLRQYFFAREFDKLAQLAPIIVQRFPELPSVQIYQAQALMRLGYLDAAEAIFNRALERYPYLRDKQAIEQTIDEIKELRATESES